MMKVFMNEKLLLSFEIMGLQYFSLKTLDQKSFHKRPSLFRVIHMIFVLTVLSICLVYTSVQKAESFEDEEVKAKNLLMPAVKSSLEIVSILVVFVSVIQSFATTQTIKSVFVNSKNIARVLCQESKGIVNQDTSIRFARKIIIPLMALFAASYTVFSYFAAESLHQFLSVTIGSLLAIFAVVILNKFVFYLRTINQQLRSLNTFLKTSFEYEPIRIIDNINFHLKNVKPAKFVSDPAGKLRSAIRVYNLAYANADIINSSIGLTTLVLFIEMVIILTTAGYEALIISVGGLPFRKAPGTAYALAYAIISIVTPIWFCQKTEVLMEEIATTIRSIECDNYEQLDSETHEILLNFYVQVTHQPIRFSALGFCNLNMSLLASIVSGVVSYQVILIQFYAS